MTPLELRQLAEDFVASNAHPSEVILETTPLETIQGIVHELYVHQIELVMQNDELRRIHAELDLARSRYFELYDLAPIGYFSLDSTGHILEANLRASTLLGKPRTALIQSSITQFIYPEDQDIYYFHCKQLLSTRSQQSCELRLRNNSQPPCWVKISTTLTQDLQGEPVSLLVMSEITGQKQIEAQKELFLADLQRSEARYLAIIDGETELVCRYLPDGRLSFVNEAYVHYFGKHRDDIMNRNFIPNIPKEDLANIQRHLQTISFASPTTGFEHRVIMPDGSTRWQHWIHRGIYSPTGELFEYQAVGRDISDQIDAQQIREHLMAELATKNEELERFTYTASHDMKAPLFTILGFVREISASLAANELSEIPDYLSRIQNSASRMNSMLQDLIKIAKLGHTATPFEPVALNTVLSHVHEALTGALLTNSIRLEIGANLPTIEGCPVRLSELFQNLIENAIKFRSRINPPFIEIGCEESPTHWCIFVKDNGIGIPSSQQKHIFDLFKKLNPQTVGSGIGLSLVQRIAQIHGATVQVESFGEQKGTTFWINFPKKT